MYLQSKGHWDRRWRTGQRSCAHLKLANAPCKSLHRHQGHQRPATWATIPPHRHAVTRKSARPCTILDVCCNLRDCLPVFSIEYTYIKSNAHQHACSMSIQQLPPSNATYFKATQSNPGVSACPGNHVTALLASFRCTYQRTAQIKQRTHVLSEQLPDVSLHVIKHLHQKQRQQGAYSIYNILSANQSFTCLSKGAPLSSCSMLALSPSPRPLSAKCSAVSAVSPGRTGPRLLGAPSDHSASPAAAGRSSSAVQQPAVP